MGTNSVYAVLWQEQDFYEPKFMDFDEVKEVVTNREFVLPIKDYGSQQPFMMLQAFSEAKPRGKAGGGGRKRFHRGKSPKQEGAGEGRRVFGRVGGGGGGHT